MKTNTTPSIDAICSRVRWVKPARAKMNVDAAIRSAGCWLFKLPNGSYAVSDSWANRYLLSRGARPSQNLALTHFHGLRALGEFTAEEFQAIAAYVRDRDKKREARSDRHTLERLRAKYGLRFKVPDADKLKPKPINERADVDL